MSQPQITKAFSHSFRSMILIKMRNFLRRSLFRYIVGAILLTLGVQTLRQHHLLTSDTVCLFLVANLTAISFGLLTIFLSSIFLTRTMKAKDMTVTFKESEIVVQRRDSDEMEVKGWDWVISSEETKNFYFLVTRLRPRYEIALSKSKLTNEENALLREWLIANGKLPE